ncbi:DUF4231 domain-containing protein [Murinocardiopsis flavida]|uniref:DUF4231 domain-containing protein n=1 Tax=Murinocardiopsis flavida TaxID=645275 RepID=UPI001472F28F|nr:DUF4231 domain-containing protein [Murinocardiopsis flavida]
MLRDENLPALFRASDHASSDNQRKFVLRTGVYLGLLVVAAFGSAVDVSVLNGSVNAGGALSAAAFLCALSLGWSATTRRMENQWHQFRACAESVKTLAWRYSIAADPFPSRMSTVDADALFGQRLRDLIDGLRGADLPPLDGSAQITPQMRTLRASPLNRRIESYAQGRLDQQLAWYTLKARTNRRRATQWSIAASVAATLGAFAGVGRALTIIDFDWLGILAVLSASLTAWTQTRQHQALSSNYSITVHELGLIRDRVPRKPNEQVWAHFTADAELAISREHTTWLARRT